jgi:hypothetical protein
VIRIAFDPVPPKFEIAKELGVPSKIQLIRAAANVKWRIICFTNVAPHVMVHFVKRAPAASLALRPYLTATTADTNPLLRILLHMHQQVGDVTGPPGAVRNEEPSTAAK